VEGGHYLGAHSDRHLLYCDWEKRDSLLVSRDQFIRDLEENYRAMFNYGIEKPDAPYFLPPYEWYNDSIAAWTRTMGLQLVNYTPGTLSHADYTAPGAQEYRNSREIYSSIIDFEQDSPHGLNGFILLLHIGTVDERGDKFYFYLESLVLALKLKGYGFVTIETLLKVI
jgi:peptidoglycan/xylan/chitin deacetylase (PgdA/CDA1 family)